MATKIIYLDNNSTTPVDPRVNEAMALFFCEEFGNAASHSHAFGWYAQEATELARERVAALICATAQEIVFTSGATESNNLALKGTCLSYRSMGNHIITQATEHKAVLDVCSSLEEEGFRVTILGVGSDGCVDVEDVASAITRQTILISIMAANNEVGTLQPIEQIGQLCKERKILFHTDAAQAAGKIPLDVDRIGADLLSISGHKIYGPKGVGALYVRRQRPRVQLSPIIHGGGHEQGLRAGTLNVPGVVGMGLAAEICGQIMPSESERTRLLRDRLQNQIGERLNNVRLNGHATARLPGTLNLCFGDVDGRQLLTDLKNIAVSSGSACMSALPEPSYVLRAMGLGDAEAASSIRFGIGRFNDESQIDAAAEHVVDVAARLGAKGGAATGKGGTPQVDPCG